MGLDEAAVVLPQVLQVEHVVQVAVLVADQVEHQVLVVFVRVDVVEKHEAVPVETGGHHISCCSIDDVKQGLERRSRDSQNGKNK